MRKKPAAKATDQIRRQRRLHDSESIFRWGNPRRCDLLQRRDWYGESALGERPVQRGNGGDPPAPFFTGQVPLGSGVEYLQFPDNTIFGYYNFVASSIFYHYDMGYEAFIAGSASDIYFYDFASGHWWYTSNTLFPDLYDFTLGEWIYYFPNTTSVGHYTTDPRYFSVLSTGLIFTM